MFTDSELPSRFQNSSIVGFDNTVTGIKESEPSAATTAKETIIKPHVFKKTEFNLMIEKPRHKSFNNTSNFRDSRMASTFSRKNHRSLENNRPGSFLDSKPGFTKVSKALNLSKEDRDQLSGFINSEELFNMIAHQRHLREDYRHFMIKQMRRDAEINKLVRTGFLEAKFDLEKPSDKSRLYEINKAIYQKRDVRRVCRTGLEKLEKNLGSVNQGIKKTLTHEDGKPISYSIGQEEELKEELRKDGIARGLITEKETGVLQFETEKPNLRWKWGFSLADQIRTLTSKDLEKDIKRGQKNKKEHRYKSNRIRQFEIAKRDV